MIRRGARLLCVGLLGLAGVACQVGEGPAAPEPLASEPLPIFVEVAGPEQDPPTVEPAVPCAEEVAELIEPAEPDSPTRVPCPAEIAERSSRYFDGRVNLRLPAGVSEDRLVEMSPSTARLSGAVESVSCSSGFPGAMVTFMALMELPDPPNKAKDELLVELFGTLGYDGARICHEQAEARGSRLVVLIPPALLSVSEPAMALLRMVETGGRLVVVVYEVHPNAWTVMHQTLEASADSLVATGP